MQSKFAWSEEETHDALQAAKDKNLLKEVTIQNDKISFRIVKPNSGKILEAEKPEKEPSSQITDYIEFKKFIQGEVLDFKSKICSQTASKAQPNPFPTDDSSLIRCLLERISSLERQLDDKQGITSALIEKQSPVCHLEGKFIQKSGLSCEEENKAKPNNSNKAALTITPLKRRPRRKRTEEEKQRVAERSGNCR